MRQTFLEGRARQHAPADHYAPEEVALANRNAGMPLELLRNDVTPTGAHYLLTHFDIPELSADTHILKLTGRFRKPCNLTLEQILARPQVTERVTLECAGNGRAGMAPRTQSMPWFLEAVGTADWTGTPLAPILEEAAPEDDVCEIAFLGADWGFDKGKPHHFGRSLTLDQIAELDVLVVHAMNGQPLLPQHGSPLRLIVPGWYGMASVKWLTEITALNHTYEGFQQVETYRYRDGPDDPGRPVQRIKVRSLMVPPGIPDWSTRKRFLAPGPVRLRGRAWSGGGVPIDQVDVFLDGTWHKAELSPPATRYAWQCWQIDWTASPGEYEVRCRARDAEGRVQPEHPHWDMGGFGNNAVQSIDVFVGESVEPAR